MDTFDYIVVEGGAAGSVIAARLSRDPGMSVLVLEAGCGTAFAVVALAVEAVHGEDVGDYGLEWEAIVTVAGRLGMGSETLRKWVRQAGVDAGQAPGGGVGIGTGDPGAEAEERRAGADGRDPEGATSFFASMPS